MNLKPEDINELLVVLNTALYDSSILLQSLQAQEHINTYRAYQDTIRKWIHLLSQSRSNSEPETKLHDLEKPWLPIQPNEEF